MSLNSAEFPASFLDVDNIGPNASVHLCTLNYLTLGVFFMQFINIFRTRCLEECILLALSRRTLRTPSPEKLDKLIRKSLESNPSHVGILLEAEALSPK